MKAVKAKRCTIFAIFISFSFSSQIYSLLLAHMLGLNDTMKLLLYDSAPCFYTEFLLFIEKLNVSYSSTIDLILASAPCA